MEKVEPKAVYEKALQHNKASVQLWESYLKWCLMHCEDSAAAVFERAIQAVGQSTRSANIWQMGIDISIGNLHMAKCHLLCYLAVRTPLLEHKSIL